jgi:hypothetical protein
MKKNTVRVKTQIDDKVFSDFSHFNAFRLHNRWVGFLLFPFLMLGLGVINRVTGSEFLFVLFCLCATLIPTTYLIFYKVSLTRQIELHQLKTPRIAYTVELSESGMLVSTTSEQNFFKWSQIYRVFELDDYTYVYITKARGFILPLKDLESASPDALHGLFTEFLAPIRLFDKRSKSSINSYSK